MKRDTLEELLDRLARDHDVSGAWRMLDGAREEARRGEGEGPDRGAWRELERALVRLRVRLAAHADKEQRYVFPYLRALADAQQRETAPAWGSLGSVDAMAEAMREEHAAVLAELEALRELRSEALPEPGSNDALGARIEAVEACTKARIRFEEELLYPAAMEVEAG